MLQILECQKMKNEGHYKNTTLGRVVLSQQLLPDRDPKRECDLVKWIQGWRVELGERQIGGSCERRERDDQTRGPSKRNGKPQRLRS